jgi:enterochelin esterase-like enzyme
MIGSVRRIAVLVALLVLAAGCAAPAPPQPTSPPPPPTPTRFIPVQLLTPRPTPTPPAPTATPRPKAPTPTPVPTVRGTPVAAYESLQGYVLDDRFTSPIIGEDFSYRVYLPPGYMRETSRRYPVLYMLHGSGGNYTEWSDSFLPEQADRMIASGEIPPMIIAMPGDGGQTYWANWSDDGPRWGDYVTEDVVSMVDQRYRTLTSPRDRAIGGLSMGGLGALNLAFQHPDVFGVVGAHSPSVRVQPDPALWFLKDQTFWDNNPIWLVEHRSGLESLSIWLDAGDEDVWLPNIEAVHQALTDQGLKHEWHVFPGPHEAEYWIEHVPDYLRFYGAALTG